jgi:invasion protein IalB
LVWINLEHGGRTMYAGSRSDRPVRVIRALVGVVGERSGGDFAGAASAAGQGNMIMAIFACRWRTWPLIAARAGAAILFVAAFAAVSAPGGGQAFAQGAVKSVHGDWQIRCDTPAGAQGEQCALMQSVTAEDRPNVGLTVIVLKTSDQKSRLMRVLAPLGVLLPSGLGLKIDNQDVGRAGFVRCLPNGCVAEVVMDDNLINQLRNGQTSTFIIFQTPEEGIGFPMSLKGFGEGYDLLP